MSSVLKRKPSEGMQKMYERKRENTRKKVREAIKRIKDEGRIVRKKELIELTGLSAPTFSQEYVKDILKEEEVCQFRNISQTTSEKNDLKTIEILLNENKQLKNRNEDLEFACERYQIRLQKLQNTTEEQDEKIKRLRGRYQLALEYLESLNVDLSNFPLC